MSVSGVDSHEAAAQEHLVVSQRVHRRHYSVDDSVVGEHLHLVGRVERLVDFGSGGSGFLHGAVAVGVGHRPAQKVVEAYLRQLNAV